MLEDMRLNPAIHDRQSFACGVAALDGYIHHFADQHQRRGITSVYVLTDSAQPECILGYYTLSAAQVDRDGLIEADRKKLPAYPVPCFRMGRLACSTAQRGSGLGKLLVGCAVDRCLKARQQIAAFALIVDAKDEAAKSFYFHFGFKALQDSPLTLYLALGR